MKTVKRLIRRLVGVSSRIVPTIVFSALVVCNVAGQGSSGGQTDLGEVHGLRGAPRLAVKTNMIYNLAATPNLGVELRLGRKITFDAPFHINPWYIDKDKNSKFMFLLAQPQVRFWTCEAFNGHFFGLHGHIARYNVGGLPTNTFLPISDKMNKYRFDGHLYGGGLSYGFQWILGKRWGFEFEIGGGYARLEYDEYECVPCAVEYQTKRKNYWGVTRAGLSFMFFIF